MLENLPAYINILFILTVALTAWLFYKASNNSATLLVVMILWLALQGVAGYFKVYVNPNSFPPKFPLLVLPPMLAILILFLTRRGKMFIDQFNLKALVWIHIVRIPVEVVLYLLYKNGAVPELMTFEGRNFDILSGITAPLIVYFAFSNGKVNRSLLLWWNIICLGLVINIMVNAVLSIPSSFQQFGFEQPNIAVLYFPFMWLPCFVVPVVLFSHLAAIRQLIPGKK